MFKGIKASVKVKCVEIDDITSKVQRMKSSFAEPDVVLIVEGEKIFTHRAELMKKSPVFNSMFSSNFKEKDKFEIELPGKNLHHFLMFLRCTLDGYGDYIEDDNVHFVMALAHEYQVKEILEKADTFLANLYTSKGIDGCYSEKIVQGILEAEKFNITKTLDVLIGLASKKILHYFSSAKGYDKIDKSTLYRIAMKRWDDNIDPKNGEPVSLSGYGTPSKLK
ncbi:BTB and MATH domain-containing protein 36-like [Mytilus edulis]|uniref:BTB and MATH domain-containing protein 36-like n=1 Tax=Mytilus edulis TaxID=6550 RepID=UPI0039EFE31F